MEPSSVEDGNTAADIRFCARRFASMEPSSVEDGNIRDRKGTKTGTRASMEPSSVEDGNLVPLLQGKCVIVASMEPSSVEDGNGDGRVRFPWWDAASMEPSSVEDGNFGAPGTVFHDTPQLQWSRPQLRTETSTAVCGPVCVCELQWSRPQLRTETLRVPALSFGPFLASMEPSSVEDGNKAVDGTTPSIPCPASMEPSSVEDGNLPAEYSKIIYLALLQWSRPQLRTET